MGRGGGQRRRRRRRRRGAAGPDLALVGVAVAAAVWLLYRAGGAVAGWGAQHRAAATLTVAAALAAAGGLGALGWRMRRAVRARDEQRRRQAQARTAELRRHQAWWDGLADKQFEHAVADLARRDGCTVRVCGGAGDGGVDIVGTTPDGRRLVVQCKRYASQRTIGAREVRDFSAGARLRRAEVMLLVTTAGRISPEAADHARRLGITIVARDRLVGWGRGQPPRELTGPPGGLASAADAADAGAGG